MKTTSGIGITFERRRGLIISRLWKNNRFQFIFLCSIPHPWLHWEGLGPPAQAQYCADVTAGRSGPQRSCCAPALPWGWNLTPPSDNLSYSAETISNISQEVPATFNLTSAHSVATVTSLSLLHPQGQVCLSPTPPTHLLLRITWTPNMTSQNAGSKGHSLHRLLHLSLFLRSPVSPSNITGLLSLERCLLNPVAAPGTISLLPFPSLGIS